MRGPGKFLDKESPIQGPWRRFRREAQAVSDIDTVLVDGLKALDPKRPIREADIGRQFVRCRIAKGCYRPAVTRRDKVRQYPISSPPCLAMLPFGLGLRTVCCLQAGCWGCRLI